MGRAKSERARSKTLAIDDLTQSIEQLQAFIPKLEDLGREGFPYLEGALARTELQLRECIKRAFGDKSLEFQSHRQLKLALSSPADKKQTLTLIKTFIASLEDKKLELQGLKPPVAHDTAVSSTTPQLTLVPQAAATAQVSVTSVNPACPPAATTLHLIPGGDNTASQPAGAAAAPIPAPAQPATSQASPALAQSIPPRGPIEPISSLFRTQETTPLPSLPELSPPLGISVPAQGCVAPSSPPVAASTAATPSAVPPAVATVTDTRGPTAPTVPTAPPKPASPAAAAKPHASPAAFSTTQEVRAPSPLAVPSPPVPTLAPPPGAVAGSDVDCLSVTRRLCQRFHAVARQLRLRGEYRSTICVEDEIDVQDLIHALLRQHFEDIGTDEWTPGYGDGAPRTTFLLDHDRLAIVVKKTRAGLSRKELTEQVRADGERYRARGRCSQLVCFIYDPEGRIGNPRGLENELASNTEHFTVDVIVAPK
jgi:hypothetical protein